MGNFEKRLLALEREVKIERTKIKKIFEDEREIQSIEWNDTDGSSLSIDGQCAVEKIVVYKEHGSLGWIPYLTIYKDGEIWQRVNAVHVCIVYSN